MMQLSNYKIIQENCTYHDTNAIARGADGENHMCIKSICLSNSASIFAYKLQCTRVPSSWQPVRKTLGVVIVQRPDALEIHPQTNHPRPIPVAFVSRIQTFYYTISYNSNYIRDIAENFAPNKGFQGQEI